MADTTDITDTPEWTALAKHHAAVADLHLRELFDTDPDRTAALTAGAARQLRKVAGKPRSRNEIA